MQSNVACSGGSFSKSQPNVSSLDWKCSGTCLENARSQAATRSPLLSIKRNWTPARTSDVFSESELCIVDGWLAEAKVLHHDRQA